MKAVTATKDVEQTDQAQSTQQTEPTQSGIVQQLVTVFQGSERRTQKMDKAYALLDTAEAAASMKAGTFMTTAQELIQTAEIAAATPRTAGGEVAACTSTVATARMQLMTMMDVYRVQTGQAQGDPIPRAWRV